MKHKEEILKKFFSGAYKELTQLETLEDSMRLGQLLVDIGLLLPLERHLHSAEEAKKRYPKHLVPSRVRKFSDKGFYSWLTPKPFKKLVILLVLGILIAIGFMLFSIWPLWLKIGIWYFSFYTLIVLVRFAMLNGFQVGFILVRLVVWLFLFHFGLDFWIFPNFFIDSVNTQYNSQLFYRTISWIPSDLC